MCATLCAADENCGRLRDPATEVYGHIVDWLYDTFEECSPGVLRQEFGIYSLDEQLPTFSVGLIGGECGDTG